MVSANLAWSCIVQAGARSWGIFDEKLIDYTCTEALVIGDFAGTYEFSRPQYRFKDKDTITIGEDGAVFLSYSYYQYPATSFKKLCEGQAEIEHRTLTLNMKCEGGKTVTEEKMVINLEGVQDLNLFQASAEHTIKGNFLIDYVNIIFINSSGNCIQKFG